MVAHGVFDCIRFEPYLRNACKRFVMEHRAGENRAPIISDVSPNKDINIAFYNIPMLKRSALASEVCFVWLMNQLIVQMWQKLYNCLNFCL